jgi:hypothetical protein
MNDVIKLAIDAIQHKVPNTYSDKQTSETLRQAFIDANGGSTKFGIKEFRRHPELYDIIETIVPTIIDEGLKGDEFFMNYVEYRNLALGDDEKFWAEDRSLFLVADAAQGTQAIRRQRLNVGSYVTIARTLKTIKIYEELNRMLSGRVDFNMFVDRVAKSMLNDKYTDIYTVFNGISDSTAGMTSDYYKSGSFAEDTMVTLIDHVEAANDATASIVGPRSALRKITTAVVAESAKSDMYNFGYYGKFNGTPMFVAKQRHTYGTDTFALDTDKVYVVANNDKFIKHITEGEGILIDSDPITRMDLTKEYMYGELTGTGLILAGKLGCYDIA